MTARTIYEHQLPNENDPQVIPLSNAWIADARAAQRPARAMAYAIPSTLIGIVLWGELNRLTRFEMHWYVMAGSAVLFGVLLGRPCRTLGALFDRRWALLLFVLGFMMGVIGDLYAVTALTAFEHGTNMSAVLLDFGGDDLRAYFDARAPLDWVVPAAGGAGAALAVRPPMDERQLVMEARIEIARRRMVEADEDERAAQPGLEPDHSISAHAISEPASRHSQGR